MFAISRAFKNPFFCRFRRRNHNSSLTVASDQLGLRICIWVALKFDTLTEKSYFLVNHILYSNNFHSFYWQALELLKKNGIFVTSESVRALVRFYSYSGRTDKAVETFGRMHEFGCKPDAHMYNTILRDVLREGLVVLASALYNTMIKSNVVPNAYTFNMLIDGFCKTGNDKGAREMLDEMLRVNIAPDVRSYTSILYGLCKVNNIDEALKRFNEMKEIGCPLDMIACNVVLDGFCKVRKLKEALSFVRLIKRDGFSLNRIGYSSLINASFRDKRYGEAHALYTNMFKEGIVPDVVLYAIMIRGLTDEGRVGEAVRMLGEMTQIGVTPDAHCYNAIIKGLCDIGHLDRARSLRLEISEHNVYTHTILIHEMCKIGMVQEAHEIYNQMGNLGCSPSIVTANALINGLCKAGKLKFEEASHLLNTTGNFDSATSDQKKVDEMCDNGEFLNAYKFLTQPVVCDIITCNTLINALCEAGNIDGAITLYQDMQKKGLSADSVTYGTLINWLYIADRERDVLKIYDDMQSAGCEPKLSFYKTLMTWMCRKSHVSQALHLYLEYLKSIPSRGNDKISVVEEYLVNGRLEQAIRDLLELDFRARDFNLAPYTILLIGFCQAKKLDDALLIFSVLDEFNININATSCVHLIKGLCKEMKLDHAVKVFLYSLDKGFKLSPRVCNHLLVDLLVSRDKKEFAVVLIGKMESFGYSLNSQEYGKALYLLSQYQKTKAKKICFQKRLNYTDWFR